MLRLCFTAMSLMVTKWGLACKTCYRISKGFISTYYCCYLLLCAGSYIAFTDAGFTLNPITDYAHLAGRGLIRHILPAGNEICSFIIFIILVSFR